MRHSSCFKVVKTKNSDLFDFAPYSSVVIGRRQRINLLHNDLIRQSLEFPLNIFESHTAIGLRSIAKCSRCFFLGDRKE